jgi:predicted transcriptional regulator
MSTTVRVSDGTKARIAAIAAATGRPMTIVIDDAVDALERKVFFQRLNLRFAEIHDDDAAWADLERERRLEEGSLSDTSR